MDNTTKIQTAITDCIDSVARSMKGAVGSDEAACKANAIKTLVEAYKITISESSGWYNDG